MKRFPFVIQLTCFLLILLWFYAASSKLMNMPLFRVQMNKQALSPFLKHSLIYILPVTEIFTGIILLFDRLRLLGLWISATLLAAFSFYISLVLGRTFGHIPCSCGGILRAMGWKEHLMFNLFFFAVNYFRNSH